MSSVPTILLPLQPRSECREGQLESVLVVRESGRQGSEGDPKIGRGAQQQLCGPVAQQVQSNSITRHDWVGSIPGTKRQQVVG